MPQPTLTRTPRGLYVHDFTCGVKPATFKRRSCEKDILARALWLEQNGRTEEAERLIEQHCSVTRDP